MNKLAIAATATVMMLAGNPGSVQAADDANPSPNTPPTIQRGPQLGAGSSPGAIGGGMTVNVNGTNVATSGNNFAKNNAMMWAGMTQAQEVELVQVSATFSTADGGDKKGLARWAELEGEGYKIAHVVTSGSQMFVFLERPAQRYGQTEEVRLPEVVEQDKTLATSVREKIKTEQTTRAEARMKQMQQWDRGDRQERARDAAPGVQAPAPKTAPGF